MTTRELRILVFAKAVVVAGVLAILSLAASAADPAATAPVGTSAADVAKTTIAKDEPLSAEQVQAKIAALANDKELTDDQRKQVTDLYQSCLKALAQAQTDDKQAVEYQDALDNGKTRALAIRQEKQPPTMDFAAQAGSLAVKELQPRLAAQVASVRALNSALEEVERQIKVLKEEPATRAAALAAARAEMDRIKLGATAAVASPAPAVAAAEQTLRQAQQRSATAHIHVLELMQASAVARQDLLAARRDQLAHRVAVARDGAKQLSALLNTRQREAAEAAQLEARHAEHEPPAVRAVIEQNAQLGKQLADLTTQSEQTVVQLRAAYTRLQEISQTYEISREEMAIGSVGVEQAEALRRDRRKLPGADQSRRDMAECRRQIIQTRGGQLKNNQESQVLEDVDQRCAQLMARQVPATVSQDEREVIRGRIRELLVNRQQLVENLGAGYTRCLELLNSLLQRQQQLADKSAAFAQMLDEQLLWIPSATPFSGVWLGKIAASLAWLMSPANWRAVGENLVTGAMREPARSLPAVVMILLLLVGRRWLFARLDSLGVQARATDGGGFKVTGLALVTTLLLVVPGPLLLWTAYSILSQCGEAPEFVKDAGRGMYRAAMYWFYFELLRQLCRPNGLADAHFKWNASTTGTLRRNLGWLVVVYPLLTFVIATTFSSALDSNSTADHAGGLGRSAFVVMSLAVSLFLWSVLRRKDLLAVMPAAERARLLWRTRILWYPLAVIAPLALGVAAILGYYDAALVVEGRFLRSFLVIIAVLLLHNLVTRWLLLLQSKILLWEARERQAVHAFSGAKAGALPPHEVPHVDVTAINEQTRALFDTLLWVVMGLFLWSIWADLLPALRVFGNVTLWQHTVAGGTATQLENITVAHLVVAIIFGTLTVLAVRNVPGVLEILLLPRLSLDAGLRYAINRVAIYIVMTVGAVLTFNAVGVGWSEVQWLAAAFSVGLGFGLQEIFANFVSGLIMLFERPVRVGDTVTVDGRSGTVSRIRMRATTIIDGDNKEIIVPNKKFITDQITNWTLSDTITRVVIQVPLAVGADTKLAERLMIEAARAHKQVLAKPAPSVFFTQFGESSLIFELRVFVKRPADRTPVVNDLLMTVNDTFQKNGIHIP